MTADVQDVATKCVSAGETQDAYARLLHSQVHGKKAPCMRDECRHCAPLNALIDLRGDECEARGCSLARCVYDGV